MKTTETKIDTTAVFNIEGEISNKLMNDSIEGGKAAIMKKYANEILIPLNKQLLNEDISLNDIVNEFNENVSTMLISSKFISFDDDTAYNAFIGKRFMELYGGFHNKVRALSLEIEEDVE